MRHHRSWVWTLRVAAVAVSLAWAASASADTIVQPDGLLLPDVGYLANRSTATFMGGSITLSALRLDSPSARVTPPGPGPALSSFFDVFVNVSLDGITGSPFVDTVAPATVRFTHAFTGGPISQYATEMLQLDLSGGTLPAGVMLRESPTLASTGGTTMIDIGGGFHTVDSFFDVFFELSADGGLTWYPASNAVRVTTEVPEPATLTLLGMGALGVFGYVRRPRRK